MTKNLLMLILNLAAVTLVHADKIKSSQVEDIAEAYVAAIGNKDFSSWSKLMLDAGNLDEKTFKERLAAAAFQTVEVMDIKKTRNGYDIQLKFEPRVVVETGQTASPGMSRSTFWIQMLPDGRIKYDVLMPHPIPFAMVACYSAILQIEKNDKSASGTYLMECGIPLFGFEVDIPMDDQLKSLRKIKQWLMDDGEDWDATDPKIPCPEDLYESAKNSLRYYG